MDKQTLSEHLTAFAALPLDTRAAVLAVAGQWFKARSDARTESMPADQRWALFASFLSDGVGVVIEEALP